MCLRIRAESDRTRQVRALSRRYAPGEQIHRLRSGTTADSAAGSVQDQRRDAGALSRSGQCALIPAQGHEVGTVTRECVELVERGGFSGVQFDLGVRAVPASSAAGLLQLQLCA